MEGWALLITNQQIIFFLYSASVCCIQYFKQLDNVLKNHDLKRIAAMLCVEDPQVQTSIFKLMR